MTDLVIALGYRGQTVAFQPTTSRGFAWAKEALSGEYRSGSTYRVEPMAAHVLATWAEDEGLTVENRLA